MMLSKEFIEERELVVSKAGIDYKAFVDHAMTAAYLRGMVEGISRHSAPATIKISGPQEEWRGLLGRAGEILEEVRKLFSLYDAGEPIRGRFFHAIFAAERLGPRIAKALAPVSNVLDQGFESGDPPEGSRLWRCERELKKARAALERTWCDAADWLQHTFPGTAVMAHGMRSKARADAGDRFTGWDDLADSSPSTIAAVMGAPIPPEPPAERVTAIEAARGWLEKWFRTHPGVDLNADGDRLVGDLGMLMATREAAAMRALGRKQGG